MTKSTAALTVPILPHTSPEAEQPADLLLPLHPHQLRALHRCLVIEQDGSLGTDFGHRFDYKSRGGCLADAVGMGKTATSIGLVLSAEHGNGGDTLVVAPAHLIPQWKHEIAKFASPSTIEVVVDKDEYEQKCSKPTSAKARIVLVDVDTILNDEKLWYEPFHIFRRTKEGVKVKVDPSKEELYKMAGKFSVKSPKGPCTYEGWIYKGSLHLPQRPWRRVIFDEIQDLVVAGRESQKNLLQLTRTATHVWLLSATPFPHGNKSVYANHELLGFCRLELDVEVDHPLPPHHPFERIKRKLYIRSPRHVADEAVTATKSVTRNTLYVTQLELEKRFYQLELERIRSEQARQSSTLFSGDYNSLREMTVHPEASEELRQQMGSQSRSSVRPVSSSVNMAAQVAIATARRSLQQLESTDINQAQKLCQDIRKSLALAGKVQQHRAKPLTANPFAGGISESALQVAREQEAKLIHDHYCGCSSSIGSPTCYADRHVFFRIVREEGSVAPEFIAGPGSLQKVIQYFRDDLDPTKRVTVGTGSSPALQNYVSVTLRTLDMRRKALQKLEKDKHELTVRITTLSRAAAASAADVKQEIDPLAQKHGSKPASLVHFLRTVVPNGEKVIVFSYWHDTLKLIGRTLSKCGLKSVFCGGSGREMSAALTEFAFGSVPIILLSAKSKASGANLQCATHVVLLDPAGSSAEHGSTLEEQAIGRAVRMGQERSVTVTRFCVVGTVEEHLFEEIDKAATQAKTRASNSQYVIQDAHKALPKSDKTFVEESNEVKVTCAITGEERLRLEFLEAEEKGKVIEILEEEDTTKTSLPLATPSPAIVKQEPASNKRSDTEDQVETPCPKRIRTDEQSPSAAVTPQHEASNNRMEHVGQFLERLDLAEYKERFAALDCSLKGLCGFSDNAAFMEALSKHVGFKPDHAVRFLMGLIQEAKQSQDSETVDL